MGLDVTEGERVSQEKGEKTLKTKQNPKNFKEGRKKKKIKYLALWNSLEASLLCNVFVFRVSKSSGTSSNTEKRNMKAKR